MKNESDVWQSFRDHAPPEVWLKRIEDSSGDLGTWDTVAMKEGRCGWLEFKYTATVGRAPKRRPGQGAFGHKLMHYGMSGVYVVGSGDGKVRVINQLWLDEPWKECVVHEFDGFSRGNVGLISKGILGE